MLWLRRLAYPHPGRLVMGVHQKLFLGTKLPPSLSVSHLDISGIDAYHDAKAKAQPHPNNHMEKHSDRPYQMIHMDMKHMPLASYGGSKYWVTIVDDYTSETSVVLFKRKDEFFSAFKIWMVRVVTSEGYKIDRVRCDNGTEQKNIKFREFLLLNDAKFQFTSTYSPQSKHGES